MPANLIVIAGPNGAGKTTAAPALLHGTLGVDEFINADVIARGISGFRPEAAALRAGRIMLERLRQLTQRRADVAFESTLASLSLAQRIRGLLATGYQFHLLFLWLPSPEMAVSRVKHRVREGGHDVAEATVRRRYYAGLKHCFHIYIPLATTWSFYDNSKLGAPRLVAMGHQGQTDVVVEHELWNTLKRDWRHD